jgi:glucosamine--fructose-6-phosphate aminotransferase (isomerizing)
LRKLDGTLFLAISQSGQSPDIVLSARAARESGALVAAIVNDPGSPLAKEAEIVIPMLAGSERSVAATKSFIASLVAILHLVAEWTGDPDLEAALSDVPQVLRQAWKLDWSPAIEPLTRVDNLLVLGRGLTFSIAQEVALKLKETCGIHAEAFSAAEVRHGPMAIAGAPCPVMMLAGHEKGFEGFTRLAQDFRQSGALVIAADIDEAEALSLPILPGLHPALEPLALVQSSYSLTARLSIARGLDPDRPPHLSKVTATR